jgi:hypothetical protein
MRIFVSIFIKNIGLYFSFLVVSLLGFGMSVMLAVLSFILHYYFNMLLDLSVLLDFFAFISRSIVILIRNEPLSLNYDSVMY